VSLVPVVRRLSRKVGKMSFSGEVTHVYNPLVYARAPHEAYLERFGAGTPRVLFMGMNPGPWGMAQTGVPFGEVAAVRDWMGLEAPVKKPKIEHPKRPIEGFACTRSEVSGRRLWGLFAERFGTAEAFFKQHFIYNYCPLVFMAESGRNVTPDKLLLAERAPLTAACDKSLAEVVAVLKPEWFVAVGAYAEKRAKTVFTEMIEAGELKLARILHPSPASPAANRDWVGTATRQLEEAGVWEVR